MLLCCERLRPKPLLFERNGSQDPLVLPGRGFVLCLSRHGLDGSCATVGSFGESAQARRAADTRVSRTSRSPTPTGSPKSVAAALGTSCSGGLSKRWLPHLPTGNILINHMVVIQRPALQGCDASGRNQHLISKLPSLGGRHNFRSCLLTQYNVTIHKHRLPKGALSSSRSTIAPWTAH